MFLNSGNLENIYYEYALIPANFLNGIDLGDIKDMFTSMFMHGGWMHLIGNMLYLWIFGDNIEDRWVILVICFFTWQADLPLPYCRPSSAPAHKSPWWEPAELLRLC
jgi:membrane associated rhomboid family serine protease